jgi:hypothetical protein
MSWNGSGDERFEPGDDGFDRGDDAWEESDGRRWPLVWQGLYPRERWLWFEQLWTDVCALRERYRLSVRSAWWEDPIQLEALAALAAWTERYDSGEWDDPPGKLALLYDLERINGLLRDGNDPFHPDRDRLAFARYLIDIGCQPPPGREAPA